MLRRYSPLLELGTYTHTSNSMHIYQRHFAMAARILDEGMGGWYEIDIPRVSSADEVELLRWRQSRETDYPFSEWLKEAK